MYFLYSFLLGAWTLAMIPVLCFRAVFKKKPLPGLSQRLGSLPDAIKNGKAKGAIWIHACSVGETLSAQSLIDELRRRHPDKKIVMSTITAGGWKVAKERYSSQIGNDIFYFPLDFFTIASRVLKEISPSILIIVDTEIWPNMLRAAKKMDVPVVLVNGRMSERSYKSYRRITALLKPVLSCYSAFLMKDQVDADRFIRVGALPSRVRVTGNMKYDISAASTPQEKLDGLDRAFGLVGQNGPLIVAGSTHPGEEEANFLAFQALLKQAGINFNCP
jgi:3-deoxy-D-manno-octulosonic-acid transferase